MPRRAGDATVRPGSGPVGGGGRGVLHVVATPIGNLGDVTMRALRVLAEADLIACEDSRVTGRLLRAHGVSTPMTPYHEHNAARARPRLLARLAQGRSVALVSDAGTPLVSDPGYRLVREALAAGIPVDAAPGASAPIAALVLSGLPPDRFLFAGFLPPRANARRAALAELVGLRATLLFLESPRRLAAALAAMAAAFGDREAAVARELTKLHQEVRRGRLDALAAEYAAAPAPKGEAVIVVGPPPAPAPADAAEIDARLRAALGAMRTRDAAAAVARALGRPRREIYARAVELTGGAPAGDGA